MDILGGVVVHEAVGGRQGRAREEEGVGPRPQRLSKRSGRLNVRPSVRRIGNPVVKREKDASSSAASDKSTTATTSPKNSWKKLQPWDNDARRSGRMRRGGGMQDGVQEAEWESFARVRQPV